MSADELLAKAREIKSMDNEFDIARLLLQLTSEAEQRGIDRLAAKHREGLAVTQ